MGHQTSRGIARVLGEDLSETRIVPSTVLSPPVLNYRQPAELTFSSQAAGIFQ